jgi:hypothetical protein
MKIFICNFKLFKVLVIILLTCPMFGSAMEVPNKDERTSLEKTLSALETAAQKAGEHIAATQQARTKDEEKSKGIQTATVTPVQPAVQPIVKPEVQSQLIKAILDSSVEEVKKAINAGADVNNVESNGKTPLWQALLLGKFGIVNALIESGAKTDVTYRDKTIAQAVVDVIYNMHAHGFKATNTDPLLLKTLSLLVAKGVDFSAVKIARFGLLQSPTLADIVVQSLLLSGEYNNPNIKPQDINPQIRADFLELIQQLKLHGYNTIIDKIWNDENFNWTKDLITFCLKNGVDINQNIPIKKPNLSPMPALFFAIWKNQDREVFNDAIENLLDAGADINLKANPDGKGMQTPLDYAESLGKPNVIRILMQRGAKNS